MKLVERRLSIAAAPQVVYELLTTAEGLQQWMATSAEVVAEPGGRIRWTHEDGSTCAGEFVELVPARRIVFTYGWETGRFDDVPPGSTTVEITLRPEGDGTDLHLVHRGLVGPTADEHQYGWTYFLDRLASRVSSGGG